MKIETKKTLTENPYLNARRTWNSHVAGLMHSLKVWQLVSIASLLITLTAITGLITLGSQSKFIPLVFQQDARGNTLSITRADKVKTATLDDYRNIAAFFIENSRLITADSDLQKKAVLQTYAYLAQNDPALTKMNDYYNANPESNPFTRATHELVNIEITSVLQESESSWQVDWIETIRNRDGTLKVKPITMKALVTLYQISNSQKESEALLKNPHGIFVRDFNWSPHLSGVTQ